ncbi:hypothetical protein BZB76_5916 [Actinomadura pelletieri DSM 43383]|uniref:Uncharacterized protein n=1 Tax=Actinomadura pelletieri DSM 43383 TaxID=1120940 RepID=A0A495QAS5_9ACTN|nr:DUF6412 domain-containing protein [Actinomadura pelletieri]RKS68788.1 hypothetical protein BZB76_5916 [Actinomadura pelletieri DSM 43383]
MIWSLVISATLRGFAVAGWAASDGPILLALATVAVTGLLFLAGARLSTTRHHSTPARVRTTLRDRTLRTAYLPQRDPDAAGRPRPRAPGTEIAAA